MADHTFRNVINGELVDSVSGETYDVLDPTTGEVYAQAPMSRPEDIDRAYAAAAEAFEGWGDSTPKDRSLALLKIADAIDARAEEINARRVPRHREAPGADDVGGDAVRRRPLPLLRRCRAGARGQVGRGVHGRPHLVDPARAGRGHRPGDAVELPADDDDLEDRPGAGRGQHRRPQAERHDPGELDPAGRAGPGVPPAGRPQRGVRRPGHRPRPHRAQDAADGVDHRLRPRGHGGGGLGRQGPQARPPRARRQGPGHRLRRRRRGRGLPGDRRGGLLQRRPGLHRRHPRARGTRGPRRLRRGAHRGREGHPHRHARRRGRALRPAQQRHPARAGVRDGRPAARPRHARPRAARARATRATSTPRRCCPASSRTTSRSRARSSDR